MKVGLVCEGGGTKAAYTSAALQALLDNDIIVPYAVGISAGAENLLPYVSRQRERLSVTGLDAASNPGAVGIRPLIKEHGLFGLEETVRFIEERAPLDYNTFFNSETALDIGLYNLDTGKIEYFSKDYLDHNQTLLKASCALCLLAKPYYFNGGLYMDAGLIDMISIEQSIKAGCERHIVISTKDAGYVRKQAPGYQIALAKHFYKKYPHVAENLKKRHLYYAEQWGKVKELETQGKALVLRPSQDMGISRYTTSRAKLEPWFKLGYDDTQKRIEEIKQFIAGK